MFILEALVDLSDGIGLHGSSVLHADKWSVFKDVLGLVVCSDTAQNWGVIFWVQGIRGNAVDYRDLH